jgi:hypothetical protein
LKIEGCGIADLELNRFLLVAETVKMSHNRVVSGRQVAKLENTGVIGQRRLSELDNENGRPMNGRVLRFQSHFASEEGS